jgi:hypothetical protein
LEELIFQKPLPIKRFSDIEEYLILSLPYLFWYSLYGQLSSKIMSVGEMIDLLQQSQVSFPAKGFSHFLTTSVEKNIGLEEETGDFHWEMM